MTKYKIIRTSDVTKTNSDTACSKLSVSSSKRKIITQGVNKCTLTLYVYIHMHTKSEAENFTNVFNKTNF